jgi:hypothetical protein
MRRTWLFVSLFALALCASSLVAYLYLVGQPGSSNHSAEQEYQTQCTEGHTIMAVTYEYSGGNLVAKWYNCSGNTANFKISGTLYASNPSGPPQTSLEIFSPAYSVGPHQALDTTTDVVGQPALYTDVSLSFYAQQTDIQGSPYGFPISPAYDLESLNSSS